ncbi:MAG: replication factor C small subunit [Candidatus Heimdallarchaeota archaeon]|nr:replication factor C small subunit [Candidatus Heimdallarchaeota archaeon]
MMWVEKYRPKTIDDIIGHDETKIRLKGFIKNKSLPHLLFAGPPGTGKTSAILALANEIFGKEGLRNNLLELNASDERGIDVIRNTVKDFARILPTDGAPFKIISLDEADALTTAAQQALRRTMEKYVSTSRFILLCNYPGKIIEPIQSRCAYFRFNQLNDEVINDYLVDISKKEKLTIDDDGLNTITRVSEGDMRKAINILQATAATGKTIDKESVLHTIGGADPYEITRMLKHALDQDFETAKKMLQELIFIRGISGADLLREINKEVPNMISQSDKLLSVIELIAEIDFRLTEGSSPDIQISALLAFLGKKNG